MSEAKGESPKDTHFNQILATSIIQSQNEHPILNYDATSFLKEVDSGTQERFTIDNTYMWLRITLGEIKRRNEGAEGFADYIAQVTNGIEETVQQDGEENQKVKTIAQMEEKLKQLEKDHGTYSPSPQPATLIGSNLAIDITKRALAQLEEPLQDEAKSA